MQLDHTRPKFLDVNVHPGMTVAVVGDEARGVCGMLAAAQTGAERIVGMSVAGLIAGKL